MYISRSTKPARTSRRSATRTRHTAKPGQLSAFPFVPSSLPLLSLTHRLANPPLPSRRPQLEYTTQDSCAFYGRQSVLDSFGGVVLSKSEGARIAEKLGDGVLVVLQNHGLLCVPFLPDSGG